MSTRTEEEFGECVGQRCTPTKNGKFISFMKPLLKVYRLLGIAPFAIIEKSNKRYELKPAPLVIYLSYTALAIGALIPVPFLGWYFFHLYGEEIPPSYIYSRHIVSYLLSIACLRNRALIMTSLKMIDELDVELEGQTRILMFHILVALPLPLTIFEWDKWSLDTAFQVCFMKVAVDILSSIVSMLICSQFGCQVTAVNIALATLNTQILRCLEDKGEHSSPTISLREIMQRQNKLHNICVALNKTYGNALLLVTMAGFMDATLCVAVPLKYNPLEDVVIGILWAVLGNIPLMVVMRICQKTLTQFRETELMCSATKMAQYQPSSAFCMEVCEWETQIKHQRMRFSAGKYFYLDSAQTLKVLTAIFAYIALFLQLNIRTERTPTHKWSWVKF